MEPASSSWQSYHPPPPLDADTVHVLRVSLPSPPEVLARLERVLSRTETQRAAAFRFPEDRERHVIARGALRVVLGHHTGVDPGELQIDVDDYGKPRATAGPGREAFEFNLSHSGAIVLVALTRGRRVGVDVERIRPDVPHLDMAARFFSPTEHREMLARPASQHAAFFFDAWTRKEAYVKGRGLGLSLPSQDFSVQVDGTNPHPVAAGASEEDPSPWLVAGVDVAAGYAAAIAVEGAGRSVLTFDADEFLSECV